MKNYKPKISIIVPVYNMEEFLEACINSILCQTYEDYELILIDDGSKDRSLEICNEYAKKDSRIIVLHKENGGQGSARNMGLDNCCGEYICFVDSDDKVTSNYLELLVYNAEKYDADISCARMYYKADMSDVYVSEDVAMYTNEQAMNEFVNNHNGIDHTPVAKLFKRHTFKNVRFLELRGYEDAGTIFKAFIRAKKVVAQNYSIYFYYQRENSIMRRPFSEKDFDRIVAYREMEQCLMKYEQYKTVSYIVTANKIGAIYYMVGELIRNDIVNEGQILKLCQKESYETLNSGQNISIKNKMLLNLICKFPKIFGLFYRVRH